MLDLSTEQPTRNPNLRHLKHVLIDLAANHTLPWKVVAAIFRIIPELRGA